jgi:uracil-DNA glycosylase family protein
MIWLSEDAMIRQPILETSAAEFLPAERGIATLRRAAISCRGCELYCGAARTVFGEGPSDARLVFVADQPDAEDDEQGQPLTGPAGRLFDAVLGEVGIDRRKVYVTLAVKHFKWVQRGLERLAARANASEVRACFPWLEAELDAIRPEIIVCLGAVAAKALLGPEFRVSREHGHVVSTNWAPCTLATFHPAAILHCPDAIRADVQQAFVADLTCVAERLKNP